MRHLRPLGQSEHSGTFLAHLTAVLAARAALEVYSEAGFHEKLDAAGRHFYAGLQHVGPRFGLFFGVEGDVKNYREAARQDLRLLKGFVAGCIRRGVYFHVAAHHGFSAVHSPEDLDRVLEAAEGALGELQLP